MFQTENDRRWQNLFYKCTSLILQMIHESWIYRKWAETKQIDPTSEYWTLCSLFMYCVGQVKRIVPCKSIFRKSARLSFIPCRQGKYWRTWRRAWVAARSGGQGGGGRPACCPPPAQGSGPAAPGNSWHSLHNSTAREGWLLFCQGLLTSWSEENCKFLPPSTSFKNCKSLVSISYLSSFI